MLHEAFPVTLFPKVVTADLHYAVSIDPIKQRYALTSLTPPINGLPIVQCDNLCLYDGGRLTPTLEADAIDLGKLRHLTPLPLRSALFTARHLLTFWYSQTHCLHCQNTPLERGPEGQLICTRCHHEHFAPISPAVILGIIRDNKLLVTRYANRPYTGPALVAGYSALGESLEETCIREALEETNLQLQGPFTYFGSQPWGLSQSLLVGFFAHATDERPLLLADGELARADWLTPDECETLLPPEGPLSLTATMIQAFANNKLATNNG
jgi:NAD+ diphosphatase